MKLSSIDNLKGRNQGFCLCLHRLARADMVTAGPLGVGLASVICRRVNAEPEVWSGFADRRWPCLFQHVSTLPPEDLHSWSAVVICTRIKCAAFQWPYACKHVCFYGASWCYLFPFAVAVLRVASRTQDWESAWLHFNLIISKNNHVCLIAKSLYIYLFFTCFGKILWEQSRQDVAEENEKLL